MTGSLKTASSDFTKAIEKDVVSAIEHRGWSLEYMTMKLKIAEERDEAFKEGELQGLQQGIQQGRKQGIQQGRKQGMEQGRKQGSFQILCGLVHDGLVLASEAAKRLNMSEDEFLKRMNEHFGAA